MHLRAISVGYAVPRINFDAVVHSVFRSAVNLRPVGDDRLITILASGEGDLPQGILTDAPEGFSFEGLSVGSRGTCWDGLLTLGDAVSVGLKNAPRWEEDLLSLNADMANPAVMDAWRCAWNALNERQSSDSHLAALNQQITNAVGHLLKATKQFDLADDGGIRALIGLGTGLTPSGDDLLTGYMAGLWCTAKGKPEHLDFLSAFTETVVRLSSGTNDISRTYLYHAARGYVSSRLFNLASAICNGADPQQVRDCAESAMQVGHTSGMETVTGLLLGLAVFTNQTRAVMSRAYPRFRG